MLVKYKDGTSKNQIHNLLVFFLGGGTVRLIIVFHNYFIIKQNIFKTYLAGLLSDNWRVLAISDQINFDDNSTEKEKEKCKKCPLWKVFVTQLEPSLSTLYQAGLFNIS